ncbi:UNKNOWN [Stylonychia lemnae]|uniref:Uncharacterized protein n=1 Tax=Stylonychia lemnae TaxID=5949 RepID=A0A077ZUV9_STYLE|nr:UNKNOWN [Stylonychia lemnae]|eukprot:CDW73090.1 UNKNOWN [Stylonychia lemnae]
MIEQKFNKQPTPRVVIFKDEIMPKPKIMNHRNLASLMKSDRIFPLNLNNKKAENSLKIKGLLEQNQDEPAAKDNLYVDILNKLGIRKHNMRRDSKPKLQLADQLDALQQKNGIKSSRHQENRNYTPLGHHEIKDNYIHHYIAKDESMSNFLKQAFHKREQVAIKSQNILNKSTLHNHHTFNNSSTINNLDSSHLTSQKAFLTDIAQEGHTLSNQGSQQELGTLPKIRIRSEYSPSNIDKRKNEGKLFGFNLNQNQAVSGGHTMFQKSPNQSSLLFNANGSPSFMSFFKDSRRHLKKVQQKSHETSRKNLLIKENSNNINKSLLSTKRSSPKEYSISSQMNSAKKFKKLQQIVQMNQKDLQVSRQVKNRDHSTKADKNKETYDEVPNIYYKGSEITTYRDILGFISLFPPDGDAKIEARELSSDFFDQRYLELVSEKKPKKDYFKQSLGDKLLFLERVDTIEYDILDEERKKQALMLRQKLDKARTEKMNATIGQLQNPNHHAIY